jgi:putative FmdB family regulatory protein
VLVPTYSYRCAFCGPFDLIRPMSAVTPQECCPDCAAPARRVFGAPVLRSMTPVVRDALTAQERSADAPEVVTSVPTGPPGPRRFRTTTDPRHLSLPRP